MTDQHQEDEFLAWQQQVKGMLFDERKGNWYVSESEWEELFAAGIGPVAAYHRILDREEELEAQADELHELELEDGMLYNPAWWKTRLGDVGHLLLVELLALNEADNGFYTLEVAERGEPMTVADQYMALAMRLWKLLNEQARETEQLRDLVSQLDKGNPL